MTDLRWFGNADVERAIETARREDKPLFVDFWHPTCLGCAKLFATTYRNEAVLEVLGSTFVCVKYNTTGPNEFFRKLNGSFAHVWHPDIVVLDATLHEVRRSIGYLPPMELMAQALIGAGLERLYRLKPRVALVLLSRAIDECAGSSQVPEALYWAGVAAYRAEGALAGLLPFWTALISRFPGSDWARRADCLDVEIREGGFTMSDPASVRLIRPSIDGASADAQAVAPAAR